MLPRAPRYKQSCLECKSSHWPCLMSEDGHINKLPLAELLRAAANSLRWSHEELRNVPLCRGARCLEELAG